MVIPVFRVPCRGQGAKLFAASVLQALQLHLVFFAAAGAALVRTSATTSMPSTLATTGRGVETASGSIVRRFEAKSGHELTEEWSESSTAGSCDTESCLCTRPERNICGCVKEVGFVRKGVNVRNASDSRDGSTVSTSVSDPSFTDKQLVWTHSAPTARIMMTEIFSFLPICKSQTRKTGRIEKIQSPAQVMAE